MRNISQEKLRSIMLVLPPQEEQVRIIDEAEYQFSFIDACERAVDAGLDRSDGLRRWILKAAFEGRLVPQDPNDEPASMLLEQIRCDRQSSATRPGRGTKQRHTPPVSSEA